MKRIRFFGLILTLVIFVISCEESIDPAGERGAGVVPIISNVDPAFFLAADLASSTVAFDVSLSAGDAADGGAVEVSYNGQGERAEALTITNFPANVILTGQDVVDALGMLVGDVSGGDVFNIEVVTTKDGVTSRSNAAINAPVACTYDPLLASGVFNAYSAPEQWAVEGPVDLEVDPVDNTIIYVTGLAELDGLVEDAGPLVMNLDLNTFTVTAPQVVLATDAWGVYHNFSYEGYGTYESCGGTFTMYFTPRVDEGYWGGPFLFTLTKM